MLDALRDQGMSSGLQAVEQVGNVIMAKWVEEEDNLLREERKGQGRKYLSVFDGHEDCRWSVFRNMSGDTMLMHLRDRVFPYLERAFGEDHEFARNAMSGAVMLIPSGNVLRRIVDVIDSVYVHYCSDVQLFDAMLGRISESAYSGFSVTPADVNSLLVKLADPRPGEVLLDPAAGVGETLRLAKVHMSKNSRYDIVPPGTIRGYEINASAARVAMVNMTVHKVPATVVIGDALARAMDEGADVIASNPPFGGRYDEGPNIDRFSVATSRTDVLFVELIVRALKPGGRAAVVVPKGVLFGAGPAARLRRLLLEECSLEAVVSLPRGAFKPQTGVEASVLVFSKGRRTESVWFCHLEGVSPDGKSRVTLGEEEIDRMVSMLRGGRPTTDHSVLVSRDELVNRDFNLVMEQYFKPTQPERKSAEPRELLIRVIEDQKEIAKEAEELGRLLR